MNKTMFWIGIAIILIVSILLLIVKEDSGVWPIVMAIIAIGMIGVSKYRPIKQNKK